MKKQQTTTKKKKKRRKRGKRKRKRMRCRREGKKRRIRSRRKSSCRRSKIEVRRKTTEIYKVNRIYVINMKMRLIYMNIIWTLEFMPNYSPFSSPRSVSHTLWSVGCFQCTPSHSSSSSTSTSPRIFSTFLEFYDSFLPTCSPFPSSETSTTPSSSESSCTGLRANLTASPIFLLTIPFANFPRGSYPREYSYLWAWVWSRVWDWR